MSKITDYAFLFQKSFGTSGVNAIGSFQLSQLNSSSVQSKLKAAGINSITGFSSGNGYHTNHMDYIFESPLVYMGVVFCINIILAIAYLIYCFLKAKRE